MDVLTAGETTRIINLTLPEGLSKRAKRAAKVQGVSFDLCLRRLIEDDLQMRAAMRRSAKGPVVYDPNT